MEKPEKELIRHLFGSIDLSDIEELKEMKLDDIEAMARAGDVELFYKNHFEKVLKLFIQKQLELIGIGVKDEKTGEKIGVEDIKQLMFAKGTINGFLLIKEWMEEQRRLSLSRFDEPEEELKGEPFSEI
jgi:hypothetical protein